MITLDTQNQDSLRPVIRMLWRSKFRLVRSGILFAILAFAIFTLTHWKSHYDALVRIEPELSTTGEETSIETEMDVLQSWATVEETVKRMDRTVAVKSKRINSKLNIGYYLDYINGLISGRPAPYFYDYKPSLRLGKFSISGDDSPFVGEAFIVQIISNDEFKLYDPKNQEIADGKIGQLKTVKLDTAQQLQIQIDGINAQPGDSFSITPMSAESYISDLQDALKVTRKGFREHSGLMEISYANTDPAFADQFLSTLIKVYLSQAYDRSSLGKINGLKKLQEQGSSLRQKVIDAQQDLSNFKNKTNTVDLEKEQNFTYQRSLNIQEELRAAVTKYKELSGSLTDSHPSMVGLKDQINFLQQEEKKLQTELAEMPNKEKTLRNLQNNINTAQTVLDENTNTAAQLSGQVEMITGYARLISFHPNVKITPIVIGLAVILLGFLIGIVLSVIRLLIKAPEYIAVTEDSDTE